MPLFNIDRQRVTSVPHHGSYSVWRRRLERSGHLQPMKDLLNAKVGQGDVHTSSWIPGEDWSKTGYQPIYEVAAQREYVHAAWCFGLLLWEVMMERDETWCFVKSEDARGTVYFQPKWAGP